MKWYNYSFEDNSQFFLNCCNTLVYIYHDIETFDRDQFQGSIL